MEVTVRLLGQPVLERDGRPRAGPRGRKAWALLAYLVLAPRPPSRRRLVSLLFADADDPLAALRWNLSQLRRVFGNAAAITGDPVVVCFGSDQLVDVQLLLSGRRHDSAELLRLGGELLEGIDLHVSSAFEAWLVAERQRLAAAAQATLYEAALDALVTSRPQQAADLASRAIELDPYDADCHTVLVRCLMAMGDVPGAERQAARCMETFRNELGRDAPPSVGRAAVAESERRIARGIVSSASARSYLDVGRASMSAGSVVIGLEQLRRAAEVARAAGDLPLTGTALVALAGGTIHGAGGRGAEAAELLHEGLALARSYGDEQTAATACLEMAFLEVQRGHGYRVASWLEEAEALELGEGELARVWGIRGMSSTDTADYPGALEALDRAIEHARHPGSSRQLAWSRAMVGRVHVLRGEPALASIVLDQSLEVLRELGWTAFLPWAASFRAEAALDIGDLNSAAELLDHAWVLATEARDHCWMATVGYGLARLSAAGGEHDAAIGWVEAGLRPTPWYLWPRARLLDVGCEVASAVRPELAAAWSQELSELATRGDMREHVVRVRLHRARLGQVDQLEAAYHDASVIDNPVLHDLLARAGGSRSPDSLT